MEQFVAVIAWLLHSSIREFYVSVQDSPGSEDLFNRKDATQALLRAVTELAGRLGKPLESMEQCTLAECYDLAVENYGDGLPEFWRIWRQWQQPYDIPPMGEL